MASLARPVAAAALAALAAAWSGGAQAQLIIVGNDEKQSWDDTGKGILSAPGKDTVLVLDIKDPTKPKPVGSLPLENTITGPPTNLVITPDQRLALVANSLDVTSDGSGGFKSSPDTKVYVIDLKASPPKQIATVEVGKQPSGMAINRAGNLVLTANRADNTVSVLSINGNDVKVADTISLAPAGSPSQQLSAVAISPDGKQALVVKAAANKVSLLKIDGQKVTYDGYDMSVGVFPYNVQIASSGKIAIVNNNGGGGVSDGGVDTVAVIDMEAKPPRVIDYVVVGDGPEGLAISPTGTLAVSVILNGAGNVGKNNFFYHERSYLTVLKIDGKKVSRVGQVDTGKLTEGVVFSPDGKYVYAFNFITSDVSIFRVQGTKLVRTGPDVKLPGHPASARGTVP